MVDLGAFQALCERRGLFWASQDGNEDVYPHIACAISQISSRVKRSSQ